MTYSDIGYAALGPAGRSILGNHINITPKKKDKYAEDFCEIFNAAFGRFEHFKPAEPEKIKAILEESKLILDQLEESLLINSESD